MGPLADCPACGQPLTPPEGNWRDNLASGLRMIGPWVSIGGLASIWRLSKPDMAPGSKRHPGEIVDWFIIALIPLGLVMWGVGAWLGARSQRAEGVDDQGGNGLATRVDGEPVEQAGAATPSRTADSGPRDA